jgi:hypothetical protein
MTYRTVLKDDKTVKNRTNSNHDHDRAINIVSFVVYLQRTENDEKTRQKEEKKPMLGLISIKVGWQMKKTAFRFVPRSREC